MTGHGQQVPRDTKRNSWTPQLAVRFIVYVVVVGLVIVFVPGLRHGIGMLFQLIGVVVGAVVGILAALLLLTGLKVPPR